LLNFGNRETWSSRIEQLAIPGAGFHVCFAVIPAAPQLQPVRVLQNGSSIRIELHLAADWPGCLLYCRIDGNLEHLSGPPRRRARRDINHRHSAWVIAAMVLLLALCGWIADGAEGARRAIGEGVPRPEPAALPREIFLRWFGARPLWPSEAPDLFRILAEVCRGTRLSRLPDLYYVAAPGQMNAYALGGPAASAIIVTEGLLRSMSHSEIAGILAHEVAHIHNQDAWAMDWAAALGRAIEWASLSGLTLLRVRPDGAPAGSALANLLRAAPAISRLLFLALSRIRELEADATALEWTGDTGAMIGALAKLEHHHTGFATLRDDTVDDPLRFLRSHPGTSERVGSLLGFLQ
jgi:heat shock protein HtpX